MSKFTSIYKLLAFIMVVGMLSACDHSNNIGSSIIGENVEIITDSLYTVTGKTIKNQRIQSRTTTQLLGSIDAGEYGKFYSDFVTQFLPSTQITTEGVIVDGLRLRMAVPRTTGFVGDSVIPMGLEVYALTKPLIYPIYSNFGEDIEEYYDPSSPIGSVVYSTSTVGANDTVKALSYVEIPVQLPKELGQKLFDVYKENADNYIIPERFASIFPGLYVKSTYGDGRVVKIGSTIMTLDYHINAKNDAGRDTTYYYEGNYYSVSPEIITNNNINYEMSNSLISKYNAGENLIVAPTGLDMEIEFPINAILNSYLKNAGNIAVINSLTFSLPVEEIKNDYSILPPSTILMVRSDMKDEFFAKNMITDNVSSFLGTYNSTSKCYEFPDMSPYLLDRIKNGTANQSQYTFTLTPVTVNTETSGSNYYYGTATTTVSSIVPYVETPAMVKILLEDSKIILNYSKQTLKK